jgi:hypothetical protein
MTVSAHDAPFVCGTPNLNESRIRIERQVVGHSTRPVERIKSLHRSPKKKEIRSKS